METRSKREIELFIREIYKARVLGKTAVQYAFQRWENCGREVVVPSVGANDEANLLGKIKELLKKGYECFFMASYSVEDLTKSKASWPLSMLIK